MDTKSNFISINSIRIHYLEKGEGKPILLIHGWPTSSYLWRNIIPEIAAKNRVIAIDLPGFGKSDKPIDASYNFSFYSKIITEFLEKLGIQTLNLGVHDLGGPIGLYWFCQNMERVEKLVLFNTLVYSDLSIAVKLFIAACSLPILNSLLVSPPGLNFAMRFGVNNPFSLKDEVIQKYQEPFEDENSRSVLLKTGAALSPKGFFIIENKLPKYKGSVKIIYGENDRILPDVKDTMNRVKKDLPQADISALPNCGHFLQEEAPAEIGKMLNNFL